MPEHDPYSPVVRVSWDVNPSGTFAAAIRERGIRAVAADIGASAQTVANYASGAHPIPDDAMIRICRIVGVPVPQLAMRQAYDARADLRSERLTWKSRVRRKGSADA